MNVESFRALADFIEVQVITAAKPEIAFDMRDFSYSRECGSAACIVGWEHIRLTGKLFPQYSDGDRSDIHAHKLIMHSLDIREEDYRFLNRGAWSKTPFINISASEAVIALRKMAEVGSVRVKGLYD